MQKEKLNIINLGCRLNIFEGEVIKSLVSKNELDNFKETVEKSKNSYEEILDKTTKSIEKFIENAKIDQEKNIQ